MIYTEIVDFSKFIEDQYLQWRADKRGNAGSSARYAREELGVDPYLLNDWMTRGKLPSTQENVDKLISKFGLETVYDLVGWPESLVNLPHDLRFRLASALFEIRAERIARSINDGESPEAEELSSKVFAKHGLTSTRIS